MLTHLVFVKITESQTWKSNIPCLKDWRMLVTTADIPEASSKWIFPQVQKWHNTAKRILKVLMITSMLPWVATEHKMWKILESTIQNLCMHHQKALIFTEFVNNILSLMPYLFHLKFKKPYNVMSHSQHKNNSENTSRTIIPFLHPSAEVSGQGDLVNFVTQRSYIHTYINSGSLKVQEKHIIPKDDDEDVQTREKRWKTSHTDSRQTHCGWFVRNET